MGLGTTTWLQAVPIILVASALLVAPGALAARLLGSRWATALAVGPALTTTAIVCGGIIAARWHTAWGLFALGAVLLVMLAALAATGRWILRSPPDHEDGGVAALFAGVALGVLGVTLVLIPVSGAASAFPQHPDTAYHLGTIRWMLEHRDISTLHAAGFSSPSGTGFYPAAFHGVAATVALLTSASPVVATSASAFVAAGVVWPAGLVLLARRVLGPGLGVSLAAGAASVAFSAFPFFLLGYGVLWPNLFGQALLPSLLALVVTFANGRDLLRKAVLAISATPGIAIAHPNALIALALLGGLALLFSGVRSAWASKHSPRRALALAALSASSTLAAICLWIAATQRSGAMRASSPPGPEMSLKDGVLDVVFFGPREAPNLWLLGVFVIVGVVVLLVRRRSWWLVAGHLLVAVLYILDVAVDSATTRLLTWPWYSNSPRLAALLVVTSSLLAAAAIAALGSAIAALIGRVGYRPAAVVMGAVAAPAVFLLATGAGYVSAHRQVLEPYFHPTEQNSWASPSELKALATLGRLIPPGQMVAANPWKGATYLYLVSGRQLLFATEKAWAPGDRALLGARLADAGRDVKVCAAARRQRLAYAITGGTSVGAVDRQAKRYAGVDSVGSSRAFQLVAEAGPYRLFRLVSCAGAI
jgi:hypothetical protein